MSGPNLPSNWTLASIASLGSISGGGTPNTSDTRYWHDGTIPWVSPKDIKSWEILDAQDHITPLALQESSTRLVQRGAVLLVIRSGILQRTLPVGIAGREVALNQDMKAIQLRAGIEPRFVAYGLLANETRILNECCKTGTTVQSIEIPTFKRFQLPLAPSAEQGRIADRIDELFTDLAAGVAALERVKRNLARYRAAVLHAAVTGRLTEAWRKQHGPPAEPGPELLERILAERRRQWEHRTLAKYERDGKQPPKNWRERYVEPSPPKSGGREVLDANWVWTTVEQLTRGDRDSAYGVLVPGEEVLDGVPLVRIGDIRNGQVEIAGLRRISPSVAARFQRTFLEGGELLMSLVGTIGRTAIAPPDAKGANTARAVGVIPLSFLVEARFVEYWFRNPTRVTEMTLKSHEVARKTLNLEDVRPTLVALPPLAEQIAIVDAVNEKLSQIDALEAEVERGLARASRLRQAILKAAFEGKLVPQDPANEPANVLLEKISRSVEHEQAANPKYSRKMVRPAIAASETHSPHRRRS